MLSVIADMKTRKNISEIQEEINAIKKQLLELGLMHPGSVSMQYQVCGRDGCRCMDKKNPRRHGPYHKLAYVYKGKPVCRFVRADSAEEIKRRIANYKTFRNLVDQWIKLSIEMARIEFFNHNSKSKRKPTSPQSKTKSTRN